MKNLKFMTTLLLAIFMMPVLSYAQYTSTATTTAQPDIVEIAISDERFSTLVTLLTEADLVSVLRNGETYTVFAPTNEAFAALPQETVEALLADRELLRSVLLSHVVVGKVTAETVVGLDSATTASGETFKVTANSDGVKIGNATVIQADVMASNGVIHVIDAVIVKSEEKSY